ncbi:phosphoserine phosphatase SerB [Flaviflexus huanghaiensis]|uniref:phosphoserine phosphatase SerB n=1 Tax=Flaviflexus huanghaiensis TaxID=1111473 RepID=UPI0015FB2471|nr:phosphoserine phosphatase SerB [Flaviflexus huanghaiensis]
MSHKRVFVLDVDATFIQQEQLDLLADEVGAYEAVAEITQRMRRGEIEFAESLRLRTKPLAGHDVSVLDRARAGITLTEGAAELLDFAQSKGWPVYLVSGGFHDLIDTFVSGLPVAGVRANRLEIDGEILTGRVLGDIIGQQEKAHHLEDIARTEGVSTDETIAIGDGANDIAMVEAAGLGVAFGGSPALVEAADIVLTGESLAELIPHLKS